MSRRRTAQIPQELADMTPAEVTRMLAATSGGGVVTDVRGEVIGTDVGFAGEVLRLHLTWAEPGPDRPPSVVVKVPATNPTNRASAEAVGAYEREILVYRDLAERMGLPMPHHLHSEMTPNPAAWLEPALVWLFSHLPMWALAPLTSAALWLAGRSRRRYLLVLEDVVDARPPRQREGGTTEDVRAALEVLARFHAAHWMDAELAAEHPWIVRADTAPRLAQAAYVRNRDEFVGHLGAQLPPGTMARVDAVQHRVPDVLTRLAAPPWTLLHGDFRLDNVLVRENGDLVVLDFQLPRWGRCANDVAYFIVTALDPSARDAEDELLRLYHDTLVGEGITDYGYDDLVADVRLATDVLAHSMVMTTRFLDLSLQSDGGSLADELALRTFGWLAERPAASASGAAPADD